MTDLFERLVAASGLPPIRLHDLRHGAATLMLAAGIDVKIVSDTRHNGHVTRHAPSKEKPQVTASESWGSSEPPSGFEPETYALRDHE
ncbi:hypothetical protein AB0B60_26030 [Streptomyces lincolnensis]|nr:hypothetical protein [Streptomyces lincolnensis]